jgi:hypothetical protein
MRTFESWKAEVDKHIADACAGLTSDDLPDQPYRDWYADRVPTKTAARRAIRYAQEN